MIPPPKFSTRINFFQYVASIRQGGQMPSLNFESSYGQVFVCGWSVLRIRFGLLMLSFNPMGPFVLRVKHDLFQAILPLVYSG